MNSVNLCVCMIFLLLLFFCEKMASVKRKIEDVCYRVHSDCLSFWHSFFWSAFLFQFRFNDTQYNRRFRRYIHMHIHQQYCTQLLAWSVPAVRNEWNPLWIERRLFVCRFCFFFCRKLSFVWIKWCVCGEKHCSMQFAQVFTRNNAAFIVLFSKFERTPQCSLGGPFIICLQTNTWNVFHSNDRNPTKKKPYTHVQNRRLNYIWFSHFCWLLFIFICTHTHTVISSHSLRSLELVMKKE